MILQYMKRRPSPTAIAENFHNRYKSAELNQYTTAINIISLNGNN